MVKGPWYISARAVREYLELMRRPAVEDGPEWDRAEAELITIAVDCTERERSGVRLPRTTDSGLLAYRGPRPWRLQLIVSRSERAEGDLPQLVSVRPTHAGGTSRSSRGPKRP